MATATKKCKVCGKEYPYGKTVFKEGTFRYQDGACCPEHGSIYLARIQEARAQAAQPTVDKTEDITSEIDELYKLVRFELNDDEDWYDEDEDDEDEAE